MPEPASRPELTRDDWFGAIAVFLLVFLSTPPVVVPFVFIGDARSALRVSNLVAITMMFVCGYAFGRCAGLHPWATGLATIIIGGAQAGVATALGG